MGWGVSVRGQGQVGPPHLLSHSEAGSLHVHCSICKLPGDSPVSTSLLAASALGLQKPPQPVTWTLRIQAQLLRVAQQDLPSPMEPSPQPSSLHFFRKIPGFWFPWDCYFSLLNVFQMLDLGTRSKTFQILISILGNLFCLQHDLEMKCTLLGSHQWEVCPRLRTERAGD